MGPAIERYIAVLVVGLGLAASRQGDLQAVVILAVLAASTAAIFALALYLTPKDEPVELTPLERYQNESTDFDFAKFVVNFKWFALGICGLSIARIVMIVLAWNAERQGSILLD